MSRHQTDRPQIVLIALILLYGTLGLGPLRYILEASTLARTTSPEFFLFGTLFSFGIIWYLIHATGEGRNWARIALLIAYIIGIPLSAIPLLRSLSVNPISGFLGVAQIIIQIIALVILFQKPSADWFRKIKRVRSIHEDSHSLESAKNQLRNALAGIDKELKKDEPQPEATAFHGDNAAKPETCEPKTTHFNTANVADDNISPHRHEMKPRQMKTAASLISFQKDDEKINITLPKQYLIGIAITISIFICILLSADTLRYKTEQVGFGMVRYDRLTSKVEFKSITENESAWQQSTINDFETTKAYLKQRQMENTLEKQLERYFNR